MVVGVLVVNYLRDNKGFLPESGVSVDQTESTNHTVVEGETLWSISEKYYGNGYKWTEIAEVNSLQSPNEIEAGQTLDLPSQDTSLTIAETTMPTSDSNAIAESTYTVAKGDHLWGIAVRTYGDGYKWVNIARANNLKNPNILFVGTVLTLPR